MDSAATQPQEKQQRQQRRRPPPLRLAEQQLTGRGLGAPPLFARARLTPIETIMDSEEELKGVFPARHWVLCWVESAAEWASRRRLLHGCPPTPPPTHHAPTIPPPTTPRPQAWCCWGTPETAATSCPTLPCLPPLPRAAPRAIACSCGRWGRRERGGARRAAASGASRFFAQVPTRPAWRRRNGVAAAVRQRRQGWRWGLRGLRRCSSRWQRRLTAACLVGAAPALCRAWGLCPACSPCMRACVLAALRSEAQDTHSAW